MLLKVISFNFDKICLFHHVDSIRRCFASLLIFITASFIIASISFLLFDQSANQHVFCFDAFTYSLSTLILAPSSFNLLFEHHVVSIRVGLCAQDLALNIKWCICRISAIVFTGLWSTAIK